MVFTLDSTTSSPNHLDLLRHILDIVAFVDRRTALKLALLSKMTQAWVEPIIYSDVNLRHESSGRAFLYTIRTSKTKPPSFFAQHVKSLVVCSDVDARIVVEILSVCRGIINFSYWATPSPPIRQSPTPGLIPIFGQMASYNAPYKEVVAPQRMSILLHENHIYPLKPHFNLAFFSSVTHLSILNSWEEWTTWAYISSDVMPTLTHIKFDLNVQLGSRPSRPSSMEIQNIQNSDLDFTKNYHSRNEVSTTPWWFDTKLSSVADTLIDVLGNSRTLRVCILVLRFDTHPNYTADVIARLACRKLLSGRALANPDDRAVTLFDSRLVFAHEREPFRYSHAHSKHETALWESAEAIANSQRHVTGYTLLDCGT